MERTFIRLIIYQSQRTDWGLAVLSDDGNTVVFGYKESSEAAQAWAASLFIPPINWLERTSEVSIPTDHPGVAVYEASTILCGRLWLS